VVFLGDVVERLMAGPPPGWRWICLQGNHELMMVQALRDHRPVTWLEKNGGGATLLSYGHPRQGQLDYTIVPAAHLDWMDALPLLHADHHRVYVHAGIDPALPLDRQHGRTCRWTHYGDDDTAGYPGRHLVHGHCPAGFVTRGNRTALDLYHDDPRAMAVAVFDDARPGGPVEVVRLSEAVATLAEP
jgi:serine/threonine protein phosphatase 1